MFFFQTRANKRISVKLLLYILAFSTFITLLTTTLNLYVDYSIEMGMIEKRIRNIQRSNLKSLSQSLWYMDLKYAQTQLNGMLELPDIQYLEITSKARPEKLSAGTPQARNIQSHEIPLIHKANEREYEVGSIRIIIDLNNVYRRLLNKISVILGTQAFKTFLVSGFIFIIVQWLITRHLIRISDYVQQLDIDNLDQVLELDRVDEKDELSQVVKAINAMKQDLYRKIDELRESEAKYIDLYDAAPDMYVSVDAKTGEVIKCNQTLCRVTGYTKEETIGRPVFSMYHPDCRHEAEKTFRTFAETGEVNNAPLQLKRKNGGKVDVILNVSAVRDRHGEILYSRSSWRDISDLKKAEEASKRSEALFKAIFDQAAMGFAQVNTHTGQFIRINQKFCDIVGYTLEDMKANTFMNLTYHEDLQGDLDNMEKLKKGEISSFSREKRYIHRDGGIVWVTLTVSPMWNSGEQPDYHITIVEDITDKKEIEKEKLNLEARIRQQQKIESIGQLAGGIAHDFNNILFPILGFTQVVMNELPKTHRVQQDLKDILDSAKRARDLVKRILLFSRQQEKTLVPVLLSPVIEEPLRLLRSSIPANINIRQKLNGGDAHVLCDPTEIHEIVMNLCTNAYHAVEDKGGTIKVSLDKIDPDPDLELPPREYLCLSVSDDGPGIPPDTMDRIFDPYFTTKPVGKGTGLGLSVVHGIVKNYKGDIQVTNHPGKGVSFKIYLPVTTRRNKDIRHKKSKLPGGNESILLVDDEKPILKLGIRILEKMGYRVTGSHLPSEALSFFAAGPDDFDLLITDMDMPGMIGSRLAKKILEIRPDIPIIICSGYSEKLDAMEKRTLNVKAIIDKPILMEDLIKNVRNVLDGC
ncbi:MAG: PAS domain S-box protein [Desulfobacterales bacterium]|nr:PAS domain S-box protein [Desulfobacterales bacterium]